MWVLRGGGGGHCCPLGGAGVQQAPPGGTSPREGGGGDPVPPPSGTTCPRRVGPAPPPRGLGSPPPPGGLPPSIILSTGGCRSPHPHPHAQPLKPGSLGAGACPSGDRMGPGGSGQAEAGLPCPPPLPGHTRASCRGDHTPFSVREQRPQRFPQGSVSAPLGLRLGTVPSASAPCTAQQCPLQVRPGSPLPGRQRKVGRQAQGPSKH